MDQRTEGAWIIHHTNKLKRVDTAEFEDIDLAGKCGILLSGLSADEESRLSANKVSAIAKASGIKKTELYTLLEKLKGELLIDTSQNGEVAVLGVTTSSVLSHTSVIFNNNSPTEYQKAAITLAETISDAPKDEKLIVELISDEHKITSKEAKEIITQSEEVGFIDTEVIDAKKVLFNGNLFRNNELQKASKVLASLTPDDARHVQEIDDELKRTGCITFEKAERIAGRQLLEKLQSIGMYDFNEVSNESETKVFVTRPASFCKYGNPFQEDALDLAKAFVSSLTYGMVYSSDMRGKITWLKALLNKLISGGIVGPAPAIGHDYKFLELKRVVQIIPKGGGYYSMKLLKKEVGEIALQVLELGDANESALFAPSSNVTSYIGPEDTRMETRRKRQVKKSDTEIANILRTIRS
jgi:hypothetical protein